MGGHLACTASMYAISAAIIGGVNGKWGISTPSWPTMIPSASASSRSASGYLRDR